MPTLRQYVQRLLERERARATVFHETTAMAQRCKERSIVIVDTQGLSLQERQETGQEQYCFINQGIK